MFHVRLTRSSYLILLKAKSEPSLKGKSVTVIAIPLTSFANLLATGSKKDVGSIRVLPSPEDVKVISGLKDKDD